ncbi:F-box/kelch-repeat protein At3g23880-like isoform X2 [Cornus florida]|nr:F-box/kelch-repeat protein At3g23880-like isoform X2 [Cornus florida]
MKRRNDTHQLPEDVTIEILLRLPVKSLIRAKAVCKNWYNIIKNPNFVTKHSNHQSNSGCLLVYGFHSISQKYAFSLFPDVPLTGSLPVNQNVVVVPHLLGVIPYSGILCLFNCKSNCFALWNPATREFRSLPAFPRKRSPTSLVMSYLDVFGFGLDPITNDYKVVWIQWTPEVIRSSSEYDVAVYTLSTDSWRHLDVFLPYANIGNLRSFMFANTCINGVYHWNAIDNDNKSLILAFDMGNELFHEIHDLPNSEPASLAVYDNSLAAIYNDSGQVDTWVMMEEGCWRKQLTIDLLSEPSLRLLLEFGKNG